VPKVWGFGTPYRYACMHAGTKTYKGKLLAFFGTVLDCAAIFDAVLFTSNTEAGAPRGATSLFK